MPADLSEFLSKEGFLGEFLTAYDNARAKGWGSLVGMEIPSGDVPFAEYPYLGAAPMLRKWHGPRHTRELPQFKYTIENEPWEATLSILKEHIRRDQLGGYAKKIAQMGENAARHQESQFSRLLTANGLCYDGQNFFDTDHSEGSSGTQSNAVTFTAVSATAPTTAEFANGLAFAERTLRAFLDSEAEPINENAEQFVCLYPNSMAAAAKLVLNPANLVSLIASGSAAVTNPAAGIAPSVRGVHNPRLTDQSQFYLLVADSTLKPLIHQKETDWESEMLEDGSDIAFRERKYNYGVSYFGNFGYGMWQYGVRVTFTT